MRKMKDSGTNWISYIPESWGVSRIASLYLLRNTKVSDKDYKPLSVTMNGIVPQLDTAAKTNAHDDRKLVKKGDFVINSRSDRRGSCGISDFDGSVSLINTILCPLGEMNPHYYNWLFHTVQFSDEFYKWGHGIVDDLWTTGWQDMKRILIPVPALKEQEIIADFLDSKCAEIDALTAEIQAEIDMLEQYKRSVISEAVTKGLDPDVGMKDSGIARIGTIPEHWIVSKMKFFIDKVSSGLSAITGDAPAEETGKYVLRTSAVSTGVFKPEEVKSVLSNAIDRLVCPVEQDTLVMSRMNTADMVGYCVYISDNYPNYYLPDKLWKIRTKSGTLLAKYAWFLINAPVSHDWFSRIATGTSLSMLNISLSDFYNLIIAVPPVDEQELIADYLDKNCGEIDAIIETKQEQLTALADYKKSLIYEYVTGKKEVPAAVSDVVATLDPHVILLGIIINKLGLDIRGKIQLQKMLYLMDEYIGLNRGVQYYRYAHGPYDLQLDYYIDVLVSNHWYEMKHQGAVLLVAGKNHTNFVKKYGNQFKDQQPEIDKLIDFLRTMKTSEVERIATLFAAWNDFIIDGNPAPTDDQIIHEVMTNWTDNKANTQYATWQGTLKKMRANGIVPKGTGLHTLSKA